jgi:phosphoribosyl 1,2-cyclic phosphodiesterase
MSLFISSLNSGSNGNCYYIANQDEAVLIDAGISCRETEKRVKRLNLSMKKVKAVFISHEHSDHINGVASLSKKYKIPIYITKSTFQSGRLRLPASPVISFKAYEPVQIGGLLITAFPKFHDADDPHSFVVSSDQVTVGVFTDIGRSCEHVIRHFRLCHAAFLESNYDEKMLETGKYPIYLKNRIRDGRGHLSNTQAAELFMSHRPPFMSHLFLSHLSKNNNTPKIVKDLFTGIAGKTEVIIAPRDKETQLYHIRSYGNIGNQRAMSNGKILSTQLSLFQ